MSQASEARTTALDVVGDRAGLGPEASEQLFAVVDSIDSTPALRRGLSDPGTDPAARKGMAHAVFDGKVSPVVADLVAEAASLRWSSGSSLVTALERQAVRAELKIAEAAGGLDGVEDELFRFARLVERQPDLRSSLADKAVPLTVRQQLVTDLLHDKVGSSTVRLARRAVAARERTFGHTIDGYVVLAAAQRNRTVATVRVARPLDQGQIDRLTVALTRQAGRAVGVQVVVDPSVVGGVRVELGDQVVEGTVAAKLENARRTLSDS